MANPAPAANRQWDNTAMTPEQRQTTLDLLSDAARDGQLRGGRVRVRGGCMAPLLVDGDEVTLAASEPLRPGQIVLARLGGELLCHRLLAIDAESCEIAGDTDLRLDRVPLADLLGRVAAAHTLRFGGARLELAAPTLAERLLCRWQLWSCRGRGFLQLRLDGLRRRLLAGLARRRWLRSLSLSQQL